MRRLLIAVGMLWLAWAAGCLVVDAAWEREVIVIMEEDGYEARVSSLPEDDGWVSDDPEPSPRAAGGCSSSCSPLLEAADHGVVSGAGEHRVLVVLGTLAEEETVSVRVVPAGAGGEQPALGL